MNNSKKTVLIYIVLSFVSLTGLSQPASLKFPDTSGRNFFKRIEYNFGSGGFNNFNCKTDMEKLFFGDFNAMVEFFIETSSEHEEGPYGFRVFLDSLKTGYIIESKRITNWRAASSGMSKRNESLKHYEITCQSLPVNNLFAEKLHETFVSAIDNFVGKGGPAGIRDGYWAIFRCVVEDELWTFTMQVPQGKFLKLTNLCKQIMGDVETNNFNESKYIELLDNVMK
ncbi:hypothetical protein FACS189430_09620 [Bacteroidia bacterium]|nr:hypothetical protein FACS189430_09620 [Bacteroidia bacterium]